MSVSDGTHASGIFDSLKLLGRNALDVLHTRLDLVVTEIAEEQAQLAELLLFAALALLCLFLGIVFVAFFVVVLFWDTPYRMLATGLIAATLLLLAALLWFAFRSKGRGKARLFATTLRELATDRDRLA